MNHLARLGLDAYRIHVWDREVSDREGNLVENEHLDLLDYLTANILLPLGGLLIALFVGWISKRKLRLFLNI